jgi:hypothetical protein
MLVTQVIERSIDIGEDINFYIASAEMNLRFIHEVLSELSEERKSNEKR